MERNGEAFSFGVFADVQYGQREDERSRCYREAREKVKL